MSKKNLKQTLKNRECSADIILEVKDATGYSIEEITDVMSSFFAFVKNEVANNTKRDIRLPYLGRLIVSQRKEKYLLHKGMHQMIHQKKLYGKYYNYTLTELLNEINSNIGRWDSSD